MRALAWLLAVTAMAAASGCANQDFTQSGFLDDYSGQELVEGSENLRIKIDRDALSGYDSIIIDPVESRLSDESFSAEDSQALTTYFDDVLATSLSACLTVVDTPGPRTLRLRSALTDFDHVSRGLNIFTSIVFFGPVDNGGATVEFAMVGSTDDARVVSGIGFEQGGIKEIGKSFSKLGHAKFALETIAASLKLALEQPPESVAVADYQ